MLSRVRPVILLVAAASSACSRGAAPDPATTPVDLPRIESATQPPKTALADPPPRCADPASEPVAVIPAPGILGYSVGEGAIYWSDGATVYTARHDGSDVRKLTTSPRAKDEVASLEVSGGELWIAHNKWDKRSCRGEFEVIDIDAGTSRRLDVGSCPRELALDAERVHWTEDTHLPDSNGGHATNVHFMPRAGGAATPRFRMLNGTTTLVTDGADIYFTNDVGLALFRAPVAVGNAMLVVEGLMQGGLALAEGHVYWASPKDGEVRRFDKSGDCGLQVVASRRSAPDHVRTLGGSVFWVEGEPRTIVHMRP